MTSRKHANLQRDPRIAITFSGPEEKRLQIEGIAYPVATTGSTDYEYREAYYAVWPDGRDRALLPNVVYWRVDPRWARYSDYARGPLVAESTGTTRKVRSPMSDAAGTSTAPFSERIRRDTVDPTAFGMRATRRGTSAR